MKLNKKNKLNLSFLVTNCTLISIYMVSLFTPLMNIDIFFKDEYWLYYIYIYVCNYFFTPWLILSKKILIIVVRFFDFFVKWKIFKNLIIVYVMSHPNTSIYVSTF